MEIYGFFLFIFFNFQINSKIQQFEQFEKIIEQPIQQNFVYSKINYYFSQYILNLLISNVSEYIQQQNQNLRNEILDTKQIFIIEDEKSFDFNLNDNNLLDLFKEENNFQNYQNSQKIKLENLHKEDEIILKPCGIYFKLTENDLNCFLKLIFIPYSFTQVTTEEQKLTKVIRFYYSDKNYSQGGEIQYYQCKMFQIELYLKNNFLEFINLKNQFISDFSSFKYDIAALIKTQLKEPKWIEQIIQNKSDHLAFFQNDIKELLLNDMNNETNFLNSNLQNYLNGNEIHFQIVTQYSLKDQINKDDQIEFIIQQGKQIIQESFMEKNQIELALGNNFLVFICLPKFNFMTEPMYIFLLLFENKILIRINSNLQFQEKIFHIATKRYVLKQIEEMLFETVKQINNLIEISNSQNQKKQVDNEKILFNIQTEYNENNSNILINLKINKQEINNINKKVEINKLKESQDQNQQINKKEGEIKIEIIEEDKDINYENIEKINSQQNKNIEENNNQQTQNQEILNIQQDNTKLENEIKNDKIFNQENKNQSIQSKIKQNQNLLLEIIIPGFSLFDLNLFQNYTQNYLQNQINKVNIQKEITINKLKEIEFYTKDLNKLFIDQNISFDDKGSIQNLNLTLKQKSLPGKLQLKIISIPPQYYCEYFWNNLNKQIKYELIKMSKLAFSCPQHSEEIITNFCCLKNCLAPLCPDCIDEHIKTHKLKNQLPEIDTVSRVKGMCRNKLSYTMSSLQENLDRLKNANNLNTNEILNKSLEDLEKLRLKLIDQINIYFAHLKDEFTSQFQMSASKIADFTELQRKIQNVIFELKTLEENLETQQLFESIKNTSNLDADLLLKSFEAQVVESLSKSVSLPTQFIFNDVNYNSFSQELRKIVQVGRHELKLVTNEKYLNLMAPKKETAEMNELREYFQKKFKK